jgi:hypothetical protein
MKPRHAVALVLVGWYLMVPPVTPKGVVDIDAPRSAWKNTGSFDSAQQCESTRILNPTHEAWLSVARSAGLQGDNAGLERIWRQLLADSECIATDDSRLKGN